MTVWLWILAAVVFAASFALGAATALRWHDKGRRVQSVLGVIFFIVGVAAVVDVAQLQVAFSEQVDCNTQVLQVLKARSDARTHVDQSTHLAQLSLPAVLDDLMDGRVDNPGAAAAARDRFAEAAQDRDELANLLAKPYPDCR